VQIAGGGGRDTYVSEKSGMEKVTTGNRFKGKLRNEAKGSQKGQDPTLVTLLTGKRRRRACEEKEYRQEVKKGGG